jgi:hypothetical protein
MHHELPASFRPTFEEATLWAEPRFADPIWVD